MSFPDCVTRLLAAQLRRHPCDDLLDSFSYEDGTFRVVAPLAIEHFLSLGVVDLVDVSLLANVATADSFACVVRGNDPVTGMWHARGCSFLDDGKVRRAIRTVSAQVP